MRPLSVQSGFWELVGSHITDHGRGGGDKDRAYCPAAGGSGGRQPQPAGMTSATELPCLGSHPSEGSLGK